MVSAKLVAKVNMPGHFTQGKEYRAIYELDAQDQGWFTVDDSDTMHWLSPYDGKDHSNIYRETWINQNFIILETK